MFGIFTNWQKYSCWEQNLGFRRKVAVGTPTPVLVCALRYDLGGSPLALYHYSFSQKCHAVSDTECSIV